MADPDSTLTPEKRLLNLIEGEGPAPEVESVKVGKKTPTSSKSQAALPMVSLFSVDAMRGRLEYLKNQWAAFARNEGPPFDLKQLNRTFRILVVGLLIYFSGVIIYDLFTMNQVLDAIDLNVEKREAMQEAVPAGQMVELELFTDPTKRNVFIPYVKKEEPGIQEKSEMSLKLLEITKDLKLTGVSIDPSNPSRTFCMIEDIKKDMTSFLKKGDTISGLTVAEIKNESVVLRYDKERIELR